MYDSTREISPEETLKKLRGIFEKIGITRIAHMTHFDHFYGIFVSNCIRPNAQNLSVSQGKGSSLAQSMVSAIMESVEAYHAENPPPAHLIGTFEEHKNENLIPPDEFFLTEFQADLSKIKLHWSEASNLFSSEQCFIPRVLSTINTCQPDLGYLYFNVSSNGLAAGNSKNEAICHGILEIIERDALVKWQKLNTEKKQQAGVLPETVDDINATFIDLLSKQGIQAQIWDITSNLGCPAFHVALIDQHSLRGLSVFTGTGAHLSKRIALFRALSEAIQGRLTYITGMRDDLFESYYQMMRMKEEQLFISGHSREGKSYSNCLSFREDTVDSQLQFLLSRLKREGYSEVLMLDHTKPELGIPVVQVFIPKMRLNNSRM